MLWLALAAANAMAHFALIVVLIAGGPITMRRPRFAWVHIPSLIATGVVFGAHADCPFTNWQKACLRRAGRHPYDGGFIEHYLVEPITGGKITPTVRAVIFASWIIPTFVSYGLMQWRRRRDPRLA